MYPFYISLLLVAIGRVMLVTKQSQCAPSIENLPRLVSLYDIARQLRIPFKWVRDVVMKSNKVQVYRVDRLPGQGLVVDLDDLDTVRDVILVRVNDPDDPKPAIDSSVIQEFLDDGE